MIDLEHPVSPASSGGRRLLALALAVLLPAAVLAAAAHEPPGSTVRVAGRAAGLVPTPEAEPAPTPAAAPEDTAPPTTAAAAVEPAAVVPRPSRPPATAPPATAPPAAPAPSTKPAASLTTSGLYVLDAGGGALRQLVRGVVHFPVWSPAGDRLLFVRDSQLHLVDGDGRNDRVIASTPIRGRWSPDGTHVAYAGEGGLWTFEIASGERRQVAAGDFREIDWSPDGRHFAVVWQNTLDVLGADGSGRRTLVTSAGWDGGVAWSPDSTRVGFLDFERGPAVVHAGSGAVTPLVGQQNMGWRMSWAPDGRSLAFADYRNFSENNLAVAAADGSGVRQVVGGGVAPAWSPDGSRIAYQTYRAPDSRGRLETVLAVVAADGSGDRKLTTNGRSGTATDPAWSPDSRTLAFTYNAG